MKDYEQEERDMDARDVLAKLKLELACRETNEHVGSSLGGNPTDFWWMLNNSVRAVGVQEGLPRFQKVNSEILFYSPKKPAPRDVRNALTKFLDSEHSNRQVVTQEQLANPTFVKDWAYDKPEVKLFIRALEHTYELAKWLDLKLDMNDKLSVLRQQECDALRSLFLKEMNLPETYFEDHKDDKNNPMSRMLNRHPVWGAKRKAVDARYAEMCQRLLSPEDNEKIEMIGSYPMHIALFVFRTCIGLERIVSLNLDEQNSCKFLTEINRFVDGKGTVDDEE